MKIPLVGPSYQEISIPFDCQRTINFYPVMDKDGKEVSALYGTPGLDFWGSVPNGNGRGCLAASNGRAFAIIGSSLWEFDVGGGDTFRGTLDTSSGNVSMDENGLQLAICDGQYVYTFTYATNTFAKVTDVDLPSAGTITFIDGYFVINKNDSGSFYISALYDGTSWAALDFATAESSPDELLRVKNALGQLWLFGTKTTEIWTNTGASAFPFERISGGKMDVGILAPHTCVAIGDAIYWVGQSSIGTGIVYRTNSSTPERISTSPIERLIQDSTLPAETSTLRAWTYQEDGHTFYVITGGRLETSLVYDLTTGLWHERAYLNAEGAFEKHLGIDCMFAFNQQILISRVNGTLYEMARDYLDDNGDPIASERIFPHVSDENKRIRYSTLEIAAEMGVGINTIYLGNDPQILLSISKDQGQTYSSTYSKPLGKVGIYKNRVAFRRIGIASDIVFKVRITDPVKKVLIGGYLS